ncbi:hypothetical protein F511_26451 [Dorcoceras hygrometricum]|uniref:Uncharacterized protein n=1 Tax=Dorcoceras hygrometricum TaxID=472368 RepID=A0A2Z7CLS4_9LAMI|nr:hypothetical protein F511_26451 [Dorcoceras hygrometricum]
MSAACGDRRKQLRAAMTRQARHLPASFAREWHIQQHHRATAGRMRRCASRRQSRRTAARRNSTTAQTCARGQRPLAGHHARPARMVPPGCATRQHPTKRQPCASMRARSCARWGVSMRGGAAAVPAQNFDFRSKKLRLDTIRHNCIDQIRALALIPLLGNRGGSGSRLPARQRKNKNCDGRRSIQFKTYEVSRGNQHFTVGGGRLRQSGPRLEARLLRQPALEGLTRSARTDSPRQVGWNNFRRSKAAAAARETRRRRRLLGEEGGGG